MILADTSAWIEYDRATGSHAHTRLRDALASDEPLATVGFVVLEFLGGAPDEQHVADLEQLLARCQYLPVDEPSDYQAAAAIYRACRRAGATLRGQPDCLIAAIAIRTNCELLHTDADFDVIARYTPLRIAA